MLVNVTTWVNATIVTSGISLICWEEIIAILGLMIGGRGVVLLVACSHMDKLYDGL